MSWRNRRLTVATQMPAREPLDRKRRASGEKDDEDEVALVNPVVTNTPSVVDPRIDEAIQMAKQANKHICPVNED